MILTDKEIRALCQNKPPLIESFSEDSLQSESYDLSIGSVIAIARSKTASIDLKRNISFEKIYQKIKLTDNGYQLQPYEYILASVKEKLNVPNSITAHIEPRTRYTRIGLLISPQHINSSYVGNNWIGLFNAANYPITIYKDTPIAQFVFEELKSIPTDKKLYKNKKGTFFDEEEGVLQGTVITEEEQKRIDEYINGY